MQAVHLDPAMVPAALRADYTGRKFSAVVALSVSIPADAGMWGGGSRDDYFAVQLSTGARESLNPVTPASRTINLAPGYAVVRRSIFQGRDCGLQFHVHPDNAAALLPPAIELATTDRAVLRIIAAYSSKFRREGAARENIDSAAYDAAVLSLKSRGLLTAQGGLTPAGRNAAAN